MAQIQGFCCSCSGVGLLPLEIRPEQARRPGSRNRDYPLRKSATATSTSSPTTGESAGILFYSPATRSSAPSPLSAPEVRSLELGQRVGLGWQSNSCGQLRVVHEGARKSLCALSSEETPSIAMADTLTGASAPTPVLSMPVSLTSCPANKPRLCSRRASASQRHARLPASIPPHASASSALAASAISPSSWPASSGRTSLPSPPPSPKKMRPRLLGAHHFVNSRESKAMKEVAGSLDFILTTVNADQEWGSCSYGLSRPPAPSGSSAFLRTPVSVHAFPARLRPAHHRRQPGRQRLPTAARNAFDVAARHGVKATTERLPCGQGQRGHREGKEEQSPLPRRTSQLTLRRNSRWQLAARFTSTKEWVPHPSPFSWRRVGQARPRANPSPRSGVPWVPRSCFLISTAPFSLTCLLHALPDQNLRHLPRGVRASPR